METLFRFVLTRPAVAQDNATPSITIAQDTALQQELAAAPQGPRRKEAARTAARKFTSSNQFVSDPAGHPLFTPLKNLSVSLKSLESLEDITNQQVQQAVEEALGSMANDTFSNIIPALKDSILAIKLLPEEHRVRIDELTNMLRDIELVRKVKEDTSFPGTGEALRKYRKRSVQLPTDAELQSVLSNLERQKDLERKRKEAETARQKDATAKLDRYKRLKAAIDDLTDLDNDHFVTTPQKEQPAFLAPEELRPTNTFIFDMQQQRALSALNMNRAKDKREDPNGQSKETVNALDKSVLAAPMLMNLVQFNYGTPAFVPMAKGQTFRLNQTAFNDLSQDTLTLLREKKLDITNTPLDAIVHKLQKEVDLLAKDLDVLFGQSTKRTFKRTSNALIMVTTPQPTLWNELLVGNLYLPDLIIPRIERVPATHGKVAPAGVADLLVVKQQLIGYEGADIAHIENVLKGESKIREHSRRRETEELSYTETEITTSEERELESTNRFEMSRETSETIKEDAELKAGLNLTARYGPMVELSVSVEGSYSRSKEESVKTASKFSQDVTERSANKLTERILERASLRVTNEVIEKNTHTLSNIGGAGHISGVYQWVNKVYQAQVYNYGLRTMFDFMVPEPGAFLIDTLKGAHANAMELEKPMAFNLRPDQITESNYNSWVLLYSATDVTPPPEMYKTKAMDFKAGGGDANADYSHSGQIVIDEGYKAIYGSVGKVANIWESNAVVDVVLGQRTNRMEPSEWMWTTSLNDETDTIPFAMKTWKVSTVALAVEVKCQRTERAMVKWRLETHAKLTQAYKGLLADYEEKLASLEMRAGIAIQGKNPALNLELMKDELKKNCISILSEQHFDLFDSIQTGSYGIPQINITENEAEGPYVRFFEQAFEWEHMTWVTYPYFWGTKSQWEDRISYEDTDPLFNQFLKAGYARVVVPAREGFEGAIDHFMTTGDVWNGGPLPPISSPLYLPIADEIAERLNRPGKEIPEGEPWLVRIPTTLVNLRPDDKLPEWEQNESGEWVETDTP